MKIMPTKMLMVVLSTIIILALAETTTSFFFISAQTFLGQLEGEFFPPPQAPTPRSGGGISCTSEAAGNPLLFIVGGRDETGPLGDTYSYNTGTQEWKRYELQAFNKNIINFHLIAGEYALNRPTLLRVSGEDFTTGQASPVVQAWESGLGSWETITDPGFTVPTTYAGAFNMKKGENTLTGQIGAYLVDGIATGGVTSRIRQITFLATEAAGTAAYKDNADLDWINGDDTGTAGTDYPRPFYGGACCRDPSSTDSVAWCFGGQDRRGDRNELWKLDYRRQAVQGTQGNVWILQTPTGTAPTRRRFASCAFVATNKMIVFGGFDSNAGKPTPDDKVYILDVSTATPAWSEQKQDAFVKPVSSSGNMATCYKGSTFVGTFMFGGAISNNNEFAGTLYKFNTGTNKFEKATIAGADFSQPATRPPARQLHNAYTKAGKIYVLNGEGEDNKMRNDVWSFDTTSTDNEWEAIVIPASERWTARKAAALVASGGVSYTYGGLDDNGNAIADLVTVDPEQEKVVIYTDTDVDPDGGNAPHGRSYHVGFLVQSTIIFQGGRDSEHEIVPDFFAYNIISNSWKKLTPAGDPNAYSNEAWIDLYARYGHVGLSFNNSHGIIGLGFGARTVGTQLDFYWVKNIDAQAGTFELQQFPNSTATTAARNYVRGFAACAVIGQAIMCCGGRASPEAAPPALANCFSVNTNSYQWNLVTNTGSSAIDEYLLSAPTLTYIKNTLYLSFGARSNGVTFSTTEFSDQLLRFVMSTSKLCAAGVKTNCISCSAGYENKGGSCVVAAKGTFIATPSSPPTNCSAGTFLNETGGSSSADCLPCPFSSRQPNTGAALCIACASDEVCPVGSIDALAATSPRAALLSTNSSRVISQSHPADYSDPSVSLLVVLIIAGVVLLVLFIIAIIILVGWSSRRSRLRHYLGTEPREALEEMFPTYNVGRFGMSEDQFLACLVCEKHIFPPNTINVETAHQIFNYVDHYKSGHFTKSQFLESIAVAIEFGYMSPFKGTEAVNDPFSEESGCCARRISKFKLDDLDQFEDAHVMAEPGEANKFARTSYGGFLSLVAVVAMVGVIMLVVLDFVLSSMSETKSLVPWPVITSEYTAQNAVGGTVVSTTIIAEIVVFGILRNGQGVTSLRDACVRTDGTCTSAAVATSGIYRGVNKDTTNLGARTTCIWNEEQQTCAVTFTCEDCGVESSTSGKLTFTVSSALAATTIRGKLSIATGIRAATTDIFGTVDVAGGPNEFSTVQSYVSPTTNTEVLSGFPASRWNFQVSPTYFTAQEYAYLGGDTNAIYRDKGYHVYLPSAATPGNQVPPQIMPLTFDTPVEMTLTVDSLPTQVKRAFFRGIVEMLSSLAGAASGVAAIIIITLQFLDKFNENENQKEEDPLVTKEEADNKKLEEEQEMREQEQNNNTNTPKKHKQHKHIFNKGSGISKSLFNKIGVLMDSGLTFRQAEAVLIIQQESSSPGSMMESSSSSASFSPSAVMKQQQQQQRSRDYAVASTNNNNNNNEPSSSSLSPSALQLKTTMPAPLPEWKLNADDYIRDKAIHETLFWSDSAGLFWDDNTNMFFCPENRMWWDATENRWIDA